MKRVILFLAFVPFIFSQEIISLGGSATPDSSWDSITAGTASFDTSSSVNSISDTTKTDFITEKTSGAGTTFLSDVKISQEAGEVLDVESNTVTGADTTLGARLINVTAATTGNQKPSPGLTFRGQGFDADDGVSRKVQFNNYVLPVQGNTVSATMYWNYSLANGAYTTPMSLTSGGDLTCLGVGTFGSTKVGNGTDLLYYGGSINGEIKYSVNAWYVDNTSWTITKASPDDQDVYGLKINYDADSDASATTASQYAQTPVGAADPNNSYINNTLSVGLGYAWDKQFITTAADIDLTFNPGKTGVGANINLGVDATDTTVVSGPFHYNNTIAYMAFSDSALTITASNGVGSKITNAANDLYTSVRADGGMVVQGDSIQVPHTGWYHVSWDLSWSGTNLDNYHGYIKTADAKVANSIQFERSMTTSTTGSASAEGEIYLTASNWISFWLMNDQNDNDPTVRASNVRVEYSGE